MKTIQVRDLKIEIEQSKDNDRIVYIIYPAIEGLSEEFFTRNVKKLGVTMAAVYVPADQWNNYLTPWPEPPEEKGFPPFGGQAAAFDKILTEEIIPEVERTAGVKPGTQRDLIGVSLSGLFGLWQWLQNDTFNSVGLLSGSFWYEGFIQWFDAQPVPDKKGKAYFLLGLQEPKAKIAAYRSVGVNTEQIVKRLKDSGIATTFQWVPGNHFSDPVRRLELALQALYAEQ